MRDPIDDFTVERLHFLSWRVLYKGRSWRKDFTDTLPQFEWCATRSIARRKAKRLARRNFSQGEPVGWNKADTERKILAEWRRLLELQTAALEREADLT